MFINVSLILAELALPVGLLIPKTTARVHAKANVPAVAVVATYKKGLFEHEVAEVGELNKGPVMGVKSSVTTRSLDDVPVDANAPKPRRAKALLIAQR